MRRRDELKELVVHFFDASDGTYGTGASTPTWPTTASTAGPTGPALMRELGLQPCQPRPWRYSLTAATIPAVVTQDSAIRRHGKFVVSSRTGSSPHELTQTSLSGKCEAAQSRNHRTPRGKGASRGLQHPTTALPATSAGTFDPATV